MCPTDKLAEFANNITQGYPSGSPALTIGTAIFDNDPQAGLTIKLPLKTLNRHGLIAGATGTGKIFEAA